MNQYSSFSGTGGISPTSGSIWKVLKKGKTGDRNPRERKKDNYAGVAEKAEEETKQGIEARENDSLDEKEGKKDDLEEDTVYGANKSQKKLSRKIDVVI